MNNGSKVPSTNIQKLRIEFAEKYGKREWSQKAVANKLEVSEKIYHKWEIGSVKPNTYHAIMLSRLYGVSCDYILDLTDYTQIGNQEIAEITGLTNKSIDFLRYLNYKRNHHENDGFHSDNSYVDEVNMETINFINRIMEEYSSKATYDADGDTKLIITIFTSMERYVMSKSTVASIGGQSGKLITFENKNAPLIETIDPLYQETLIKLIRKELDYLKEKEDAEKKNAGA